MSYTSKDIKNIVAEILERIRSSVCPAIREIHRKRLQQQSLVRKKEQQ